MKPWWSIPIFAMGLLAGFVIGGHRRDHTGPDAPLAATTKSVSRRMDVVSPKEEKLEKWRRIARGVDDDMDFEQRESFVKELKPEDYIAAVEAIVARAGPDGLSTDLKSMVEDIIEKWGREDFDGAWRWSMQCEPFSFRRSAKRLLLDGLLETRPDRALELHVMEVEDNPYFSSKVSEYFVKEMALKDAGSFVDVLSKFQTAAPRSFQTTVEFAPDFDFLAAADGVMAQAPKPSEFPENFVSEWCKHDVQAAHQWLMKGGELPFGSWNDVLQQMTESKGLEDAGAWAAREIEGSGKYREHLIEGLTYFSQEPEAEASILAIADAMPDVSARDRLLSDVVAKDPYTDPDLTQALISDLSSPEARLEAFRKIKKGRIHFGLSDIRDETFREWGVSRAQAKEIMGYE